MTEDAKDPRENSEQNDAADATVAVAEPESMDEMEEMENGYEWKEPPVFDISCQDDCVCEIKVTIPKTNVMAMLDEVYEEVNDGVQVPGFRRGKAPRKLLEKRLGKYARTTVAERLAEHASKKMIHDSKVIPISKVEYVGLEDAEHLAEDQDLVYTMKFDINGKCTLGEYKGLELERPEYAVPDSDVDAAMENMQQRFGRYEPLTDGVAEDNDQVIIDFKGTINGEEFEGNSAENYPYILGTQRFLPAMEAALKGAQAGQTVEADVDFPEDYREKSLAGQQAHFVMVIHEIKRRVLPDLDDELAKKLGHETVAEWRENVRNRMSENANEQIQEYLKNQALHKLVECSSFELPKSQIAAFVDGEYAGMEERLIRQHVPMEVIEEQREEMRKQAEEQGLFSLKALYAVRAAAEQESVSVTESDFEEYARTLTHGDDNYLQAMRDYLASAEMRSMSEYRILEQKVLDKLVSCASITVMPAEEEKDPDTTEEEKDADTAEEADKA